MKRIHDSEIGGPKFNQNHTETIIHLISTGLLEMERLKNEELAGHVTLVKGEQSEVAEMGARLL